MGESLPLADQVALEHHLGHIDPDTGKFGPTNRAADYIDGLPAGWADQQRGEGSDG